jgi:2-dehydro-3-deoxygalactonokinase
MGVRKLLVDWGTTSFRLWAVGADDVIMGERRSGEGLTSAGDFDAVLESHAAALGVGSDVPAILCGMVGARNGWLEAPYLDAPVPLSDVAGRATRVTKASRAVFILPGVCQRRPAPDVMRGEETKLLGLGRDDGLVLMPGTHTKWARLDGGLLAGFSTFMTGEIFAHLRGAPTSVLRQAVGEAPLAQTSGPVFADAVRMGFETPERLANAAFGVRAGWLIDGAPAADGLARLSGLLIGAEIAGAQTLYGDLDGVVPLGAGPGAQAYLDALAALDIAHSPPVDADGCVRAGLSRAADILLQEIQS